MTSDTSPRLSVVATSDVSRHQTADQSSSASQVNVCESESVWHFIDGDKKGTLTRHFFHNFWLRKKPKKCRCCFSVCLSALCSIDLLKGS